MYHNNQHNHEDANNGGIDRSSSSPSASLKDGEGAEAVAPRLREHGHREVGAVSGGDEED